MNLAATIILICVGVVALIIGATLYYLLVYASRNTRKWVKQIEDAVTDDDILAIGDSYNDDYGYYSRRRGRRSIRDKARQSAATLKHYDANHRANARKYRAEFDLVNTPYDRAHSYVTGDARRYDYSLAFGKTEPEVAQSFLDDMAETLRLVRTGDRVAMHGYTQVMNLGCSKFCERLKIAVPAYPSDWDDLVTKFIPNPSVSDFRGTPELATGDVRLKAAEALRKRSRKLAKLVLAYCLVERDVLGESDSRHYGYYGTRITHSDGRSRQTVWPFRDAIGDTLLAQLIVMVDAMEGSDNYSKAITLNKPAD